MNIMEDTIPIERIERRIHLFRGSKVLLDRDLAELYGVETKQLKRAVNRNMGRFPTDCMFQLREDEVQRSRCQIGTLKRGQNVKYLPYAFTENGVAMLSSVLKSERAIQVNVQIMRTFTKLRQMLTAHRQLDDRLGVLERKFRSHDDRIREIFDAIRELMAPPEKPRRPLGFRP